MKISAKLIAYFFAALLLFGGVSALAASPARTLELAKELLQTPRAATRLLGDFVAESLPLRSELRTLSVRLRIAGGMERYHGVFVTENGLIADFRPTGETLADANTQAVNELAAGDTPAYLMLLPTACAIYQERISGGAELYDQKGFIERTYRALSGRLSTVDVYPVLFSAREDYLYYRTGSGFTSLGGMKIYQTLARRLGNTPRQLSQFEILPLCGEYYGDLYDTWGYGGIRPDVITAYCNSGSSRRYTVTHYEANGDTRVYYSLYPQQAAVVGNDADAVLGGLSPVTVIRTVNASGRAARLLVFGDDTAAAYLPLLAQHYDEIAFVRAGEYSDADAQTIDLSSYDQIVFAYSLETYMNTDEPQRAAVLAQ